ncbi:hypothetical protein QP113_08215, partial [Lactobacillus mulieris]
ETIPYTPKEITVGDKVYVPAEDGNKTVTLTDKPQTVEVAYKEKDASTEVKYQPKVGGETKGTPITIDVPSGAHHQGETIPYTPKEITVGDK